MAKKLQFKRLIALTLFLGLAFVGLGYRLVDLQVLRHEELRARAQQNTQREFLLEPRRGDILDAKGNLLATSVLVKTVCADPTFIGNHQAEIARVIAPLLQTSEAEIYQKLLRRTRQNEKGETITNRYVVLKRKVPIENWQRVRDAMTGLSFGFDEKKLFKAEQNFFSDLRKKAVFVDPYNDQLRVYPNQTLAAHVLGFTGGDEREWNGKFFNETTGREGIEFKFNSQLSGARGWRITEIDRRSRELLNLREQDVEPRDGLNIVLSIDSVVQHFVETALAAAMEKNLPISASAIVLRPRTGEILAMATLPNFDPNHLESSTAETRRNRVITDTMEPGSTFKIVVVSGALNDRAVQLNEVFDCENGQFHFAGHTLHDAGHHFGNLAVQDIIMKSSNIGAAKIGIRLGANRLYDYMRNFGFGTKTDIPLPSEMVGWVHQVPNWSKVSIAQIPMGQGVTVTRLQMTMAMCAIANNGWLMRPILVDRLQDRDGKVIAKYVPQRVRQVISDSTAKLMVTALKTVVSPEGTAPKAALEHYTVAGKTGTAQKAEHGVYVDKFVSSFIGFFPADNPELCVSVVLDEPKGAHFGGEVAGPVFKQIAESAANYLNIRPDKDGEPTAPDSLAETATNFPLRAAAARAP